MVLVIAHRGYSGKFPENTILAMKEAVAIGCDGIEFDIRVTKDKELVIFHEDDLRRLCNIKGKLSSKTIQEIKKLDVGGEKIPTLDEALKYLKKTKLKLINLEVKTPGHEEKILKTIHKHKIGARCIISSYYYTVLQNIRKHDSDIRLGYVMDNRPDRWRTLRWLHANVGLYSANPYHNRTISTSSYIRKVKSMGLKVLPWFLRHYRNPKRAISLSKMGVDGIMTDYPEEIIIALKN